MKNIITALLFLVAFSSCSSITSLSMLDGGKLEIPKKENYKVVYKANFAEDFVADISYTDELGKSIKLKDFKGNWNKTVIANSGTQIKVSILAKSSNKAKADFDVSVDGESISSYDFNGKRVNYSYKVELP